MMCVDHIDMRLTAETVWRAAAATVATDGGEE